MKKIISLLLASLLALALITGCSLEPVENDDPTPTSPTGQTPGPDDEYDLTTLVAKVGDEEITLEDYKQVFDMYLTYFTSYGYDITGDQDTLEMFQDDVLNLLISEKLPKVKAKELGYDQYTAEQQAELDVRVQAEIDDMHEYFKAQAELEAEGDAELDVDERAMEMILEEAAYNLNKEDATYEEYVDYISEMIENNYLVELMKENLLGDVSVSEEEVTEYYNETLSTQKDEYAEYPAYYAEDLEYYEASGGAPVLVVPEGYSRYMHIFIAYDEQFPSEYVALGNDLEDLMEEFGKLAFEQALNGDTANAARMSEILTEYKRIESEREAISANFSTSAKDTIAAAYARLQNGEAFKEVMADTTQDVTFLNSGTMMQNGRLINKTVTLTSGIEESVLQAFNTLERGQYSEVFEDSDGFHIIYYVSDETPGDVALSEVYAAIEEMLLSDKLDEEWQVLVDSWYADGTVTIYEDVYRSLGK